MRPRPRGFIGHQEANYIQLLLGHPEPRGKEAALERLCTHYRAGNRLRDSHAVCQTLTAMLYNADTHVRRWAFNAIALVGNRELNLEATLDALERNRGDADTFAAGVAAVVALTAEGDVQPTLRRIGIEMEGAALLAAAQQAPVFKEAVAAQRVNPDKATAAELKLAAILIGTDKAPENLFSINYDNSHIIGSLYIHHDPQVAQYSTWAICEHPMMSYRQLGFPVAKLAEQPPDVRKYGVRLISADNETAERHREQIEEASWDESRNAREGLAIGLASSYFPGLEDTTLEWLSRETDSDIRDAVVDHFVAQSERCAVYEDQAKEVFRNAGAGSMLRAKLLARAEQKPIFREFKKIELDAASVDLFGLEGQRRGNVTVNKSIIVNAQNVGVVADTSKVTGGIHQSAVDHKELVSQRLRSLSEQLADNQHVTGVEEGRKLVAEAQENPSKTTVERVVNWLKAASAGSGFAVTAVQHLHSLADQLTQSWPHLPSA